MRLDDWIEHARRDAARRGLPDLEPLLDMLYASTRALRADNRGTGHARRPGGRGGAPVTGQAGAAAGGGSTDRPAADSPAAFPDAAGALPADDNDESLDADSAALPPAAAGRPTPPTLASAAAPGRTIAAAGRALRRGEITAADLVEACLAAIAEHDPALNACIAVLADDARRQAQSRDTELAHGVDRGPLHGIPVSLKDIIDVAGWPTTAASKLRAGHRAAADAPVVTRLRDAGAIIVAKCNLHEFAFGTTGEESARGPTRNPHAPAHMPGGSSSGSAVSVAAGMALGSVGTDTGGSIRIPAAACGVVGLKPTHGEVSTAGIVPLAPSLDHVGPLARSVEDAALLHGILRDGGDSESTAATATDPQPRLGIPRRYFLDLVEPPVRDAFAAAVERLEHAGCRIDDVDLPHAADTAPVYLHLQLAEAAEGHRADLDRRPEEYGRGVRLRLELGRYVLAEDYVRAQGRRRILTAEVNAALQGRAALALPTLPVVPPRLGATMIAIGGTGGTTGTVRALTLRLTQLFDVTGHPAISVPCGTAGGLPAGLQLVGRRGGTARLLALAAALEDAIRG